MKKTSLLVSFALVVSLPTHAGFGLGSLSSLASKATEAVTGVSSSNIDLAGFFQQAQATHTLFLESRAAIASLLANKEDSNELKSKLKALKTTTDPKEINALEAQVNTLSSTVLDAAQKDEAATVSKLSALDKEQKALLLNAATNFALAGLSARELVINSKQVSAQIMTNPMSLTQSGLSLTHAQSLVSNLTGITKNAGFALVEFPKVFKKAGINFQVPTSTATKPVDISSSLL